MLGWRYENGGGPFHTYHGPTLAVLGVVGFGGSPDAVDAPLVRTVCALADGPLVEFFTLGFFFGFLGGCILLLRIGCTLFVDAVCAYTSWSVVTFAFGKMPWVCLAHAFDTHLVRSVVTAHSCLLLLYVLLSSFLLFFLLVIF